MSDAEVTFSKPGLRVIQDSQEDGPDGARVGSHDNTRADENDEPEAPLGPDNQPAAGTQPTQVFYDVNAPYGVFGVQINYGEPR